MICPKCGVSCRDGAKFCTNCGSKLQPNESSSQGADEGGLLSNLLERGKTITERPSRAESPTWSIPDSAFVDKEPPVFSDEDMEIKLKIEKEMAEYEKNHMSEEQERHILEFREWEKSEEKLGHVDILRGFSEMQNTPERKVSPEEQAFRVMKEMKEEEKLARLLSKNNEK